MEIVKGPEYIEKGSKFFGFYAPINNQNQFKEFMATIKAEHPLEFGDHYVYAYRFIEPQFNMLGDKVIHEKSSNAGEPANTGRAILSLLQERNLENCALIIVRYFGGILLGAENVPKAYAKAGELTLEEIAKT